MLLKIPISHSSIKLYLGTAVIGSFVGVGLALALARLSGPSALQKSEQMATMRLTLLEKIRPLRENLAKQVTIQKVEVTPLVCIDDHKHMTYRVYWVNRGPKPIASLYAKIDVIDIKTGEKTADSTHKVCIFSSPTDEGRIQSGQAALSSKNGRDDMLLHLDLYYRRPVRVVVTPVLADEYPRIR